MLTVIAEFPRVDLAVDVDRRLTRQGVLTVLADLMVRRGAPNPHQIRQRPFAVVPRTDSVAQFAALAVRDGTAEVGAKTLFIGKRSAKPLWRARLICF